ncbi:hypothetical protein [Halovulum sp. GXIMD14793]
MTGISRETLMEIYQICVNRRKCCLVGFNDYSKHIVNLLPEKIEAIIDDDPAVLGIEFRGTKVVASSGEFESHVMVVCKYDYLSEYTAKLKFRHDDRIIATPKKFGDQPTRFADPYRHDALQRAVFRDWQDVPNSMMSQDKIMFLVELLKSCASLKGNVAEFGV